MSNSSSEALLSLLESLPVQHRRALQWFHDHADSVESWLAPLQGDVLLATRAKGIYKPRWSKYALSVREVPGQYPDTPPQVRVDVTWTYLYHQESFDPDARDNEPTNRALLANHDDRAPVGVMRSVSGRPHVRYHVLGLALVEGWEKGVFHLAGLTHLSRIKQRGVRA